MTKEGDGAFGMGHSSRHMGIRCFIYIDQTPSVARLQ
ncbi:pantothenate kinase [Moniliophthora roreri]|nr:pantothenate kinase [Moniliophthora roreri]